MRRFPFFSFMPEYFMMSLTLRRACLLARALRPLFRLDFLHLVLLGAFRAGRPLFLGLAFPFVGPVFPIFLCGFLPRLLPTWLFSSFQKKKCPLAPFGLLNLLFRMALKMPFLTSDWGIWPWDAMYLLKLLKPEPIVSPRLENALVTGLSFLARGLEGSMVEVAVFSLWVRNWCRKAALWKDVKRHGAMERHHSKSFFGGNNSALR